MGEICSQGALTLDQRKEQNFRNYFFYIEAIFYFLQGTYTAGLQVYMTYYMTHVFKLDYTTIATVMALVGIPTYLKMFTGLLSDRVPIGRFGRRKPYLFIGGLLFIPAFIALATIKTYSIIWLLALIACFACFVIIDGTADALTVDITPDKYTAKMQGYANGGRYIGMAVGTILSSFMSTVIGWNVIIVILGISAVGQAVAAMMFKEIDTEVNIKNMIPIGKSLKTVFTSKGSWLGLGFTIFFMGGMGLANLLSPLVMANTDTKIYGITSMVNFFAVALAAFGTGTIITKIGGFTYKNIIKAFAVIWILMLPWLLVNGNWDNTFLVILAQATLGLARGITTVVTYSIIMRLCAEAVEGFMFAIFTSAMNIGSAAIAPKIVAFFGETVGMGIIPAAFTMIPFMFIGILMIPGINKSIEERIAA